MKYRYRSHPSRLATLIVTFGGGARAEYQKEYPAGIAHFMEHVRFKGTEKYTSKDLTRKVAFYGGSWNAFTSKDLVSYHLSIPDDNLEQACEFLSQIVRHPTFPQDELEREKEVVCQEVRMYEDDINDRVHTHLMGKVFQNAKATNIVGTEKSVRSITRDDLVKFNNEFYNPEQMLITLSSRHDRKDFIEKYFGIPDDTLVYPPRDTNPVYGESFKDTVHKDGLIQETISVCHSFPDYSIEDRAVGKVFNSIFGGSDDARLFMRVREDMGLVYGIGSYIYSTMDGTIFAIGTETDPENTSTVLDAVDEEIARMRDELPTEEELQRAKNRIRSSEYRAVDSSYGAAMKTLYEEFYGHTSGSEFLSQVDEVSAEQVKEFANRVFSNNKYVVVGTSKEKENE